MDRHTHNSFLGMITLCMVTLTAVVFVATRLHGVVLEPLMSDQVVTRIAQVAAVADFEGSLVARYSFDEGSGTTAADTSGGHTGTLSGGTGWGSGHSGGAVDMNGSSGAVVAPDDFIGTGALSVSLWVYPRGPGQITASILDNGSTRILFGSSNRVVFCSNGVTCPNSASGALPLGTWTHVVVTRDAAGSATFYVNGSVSGTAGQSSGSPTAGTVPVRVGNSPNGAHTFDGLVDELRIYNRVLTPSEIAELYTYTGGVSTPPSTPPPTPPADTTPPPPSPTPVNGQCSTTLNTCTTGTFTDTTDTPSTYLWSCTGSNGGTTASCTLPIPAPQTPTPPTGPTITVKKDGTGAYTTIQACAAVVQPGQTCLVYPGVYDERVSVVNGGNAGSPVTFKANGSGAVVRGFTISNKNYVTIDGFEVTHQTGSGTYNYNAFVLSGTVGVQIINNDIHHTDADGINFGNSSFLQIRNNRIRYIGYPVYPRSGRAAILGIYGQPSSDVLIENNAISYVADYLNPYGTRFVYRNNTIGPVAAELVEHVDGVQPNGITTRSLMEGNVSINNVSSDNHFFLNQRPESAGWIIRYNVTNGSKGGLDWRDADNHYFYNNTFHRNYVYYASGFQILLTSSTGNIARNNIWYQSVSSGGNPYAVGTGSGVDKDYDLWFNSGNPQETHAVNADPLLNGDLTLQPSSPAIDHGGPLTTATNAGSNATMLRVGDAGPFQDGWAGVQHDWISVGATGNYSEIASIDYTTNTITLRTPLTWSINAPIYLFKDSTGRQVLYGSAPDIGAFEYGSGTLTTVPTQPTTPTPPTTATGDFNRDGKINSLDFSLLQSVWQQSSTTYDLNGDGVVNTLDYALMVRNWTG